MTLSLGSSGCWNYSNSCTLLGSVWSVMKSIWRFVKFWQIIILSACYPIIDNSRKFTTLDNFCRWRTSLPGKVTIPCWRSSSWKTRFGASLTRREKSNSGANPVLLKWTWPENEVYVRANKCTDSSLLFRILACWFIASFLTDWGSQLPYPMDLQPFRSCIISNGGRENDTREWHQRMIPESTLESTQRTCWSAIMSLGCSNGYFCHWPLKVLMKQSKF